MTDKRFTMIYFETDGNLIFDETKHNGEWYDSTECLQDNEIVELLNELHEENNELHIQNDFLKDENQHMRNLVNENEQLRHDATILIQANQDYRKENEQLKQQLKELKEDVPLLLAFYRWYPFAVEKKEHQAYNRLWDFVND